MKLLRSILKRKKETSKDYSNSKQECPVCKQKTVYKTFPYEHFFNQFFEHGFVHSPFLFETLNLKEYSCAVCNSNDRDRIIASYLQNELTANKEYSLLDFAPSTPLQKFIKNYPNIVYRSADLFMENVDDKVDIKNMDIYEDNSFDVFICSHILEHIDDDTKAMSELYRVTKPNGFGVCLVPILLSLDKSLENEEYTKSETLRWKYFGQDDHVRMYSKNDFVQRLESVGFKVEQLGIDYFGQTVFDRCGLDKKSVLYVVKKI